MQSYLIIGKRHQGMNERYSPRKRVNNRLSGWPATWFARLALQLSLSCGANLAEMEVGECCLFPRLGSSIGQDVPGDFSSYLATSVNEAQAATSKCAKLDDTELEEDMGDIVWEELGIVLPCGKSICMVDGFGTGKFGIGLSNHIFESVLPGIVWWDSLSQLAFFNCSLLYAQVFEAGGEITLNCGSFVIWSEFGCSWSRPKSVWIVKRLVRAPTLCSGPTIFNLKNKNASVIHLPLNRMNFSQHGSIFVHQNGQFSLLLVDWLTVFRLPKHKQPIWCPIYVP